MRDQEKFWENMRAVKFLLRNKLLRRSTLYYMEGQTIMRWVMIRLTFTTINLRWVCFSYWFHIFAAFVIYGFKRFLLLLHIFFILAVIFCYFRGVDVVGVLYGGAIGGIVGAVNVATNNALRLEKGRIKRLQQRQQGRQIDQR